MSSFEETYGPLTESEIEGLDLVVDLFRNPNDAIAFLINKVAYLEPTYGNLQYVLDSLAGDEKGV